MNCDVTDTPPAAWKAAWVCAPSHAEAFADALTDHLIWPADAVAMTPLDAAGAPTDAEDDPAQWRVEAYYAEPPDWEALCAALAAWSQDSAPAIEALPDRDWVAASLEGLGIVRAGRFQLYGVHDAERLDPAEELIAIRIDANQAFGTGHHPTTAGCLEALDALAETAPASVLDLGCGSAVLAIAAAKLWGAAVLGSDIDAGSVEIARENCRLNEVAHCVRIIEADGLDHDAIAAAAPFELICANILAGPLVALAPAIAAACAPRGRVILAGLLDEQRDGVIRAYAAQGFAVERSHGTARWPVLTLIRS